MLVRKWGLSWWGRMWRWSCTTTFHTGLCLLQPYCVVKLESRVASKAVYTQLSICHILLLNIRIRIFMSIRKPISLISHFLHTMTMVIYPSCLTTCNILLLIPTTIIRSCLHFLNKFINILFHYTILFLIRLLFLIFLLFLS